LMETLPKGRMGRLMARNHLLFILSNIGGWGFALGVLAMLPYRLAHHAIRGNWRLVGGHLAALGRAGPALRRRWRRPPPARSARAIVDELARPLGHASILPASRTVDWPVDSPLVARA
jgi:hypothetical protein